MLFNSLEFAVFLPIFFIMYWFVFKKLKKQNLLIVLASYFFYGSWDFRFLALIFFSTFVDFYVAKLIGKSNNKLHQKILLIISLTINLGFLSFFKYYNFFIDSFSEAFTFFGSSISINRLNIILPVGISFYTFQTLSYTIDVYKKKIKPSNNFIAFTAFVSFFPQLVAGPIERASHLLPQFSKKRVFSNDLAVSGIQLIVWGMFKKVVIADNASIIVDGIFNNYANQSAVSLSIGAVFFAFQIYGDFSGYSDIAIGLARLFGFNLMTNFKFPYLSKNIGEFWKKWHISLSTWFRDYLYFPLGGSRGSLIKSVRNVFIIFLVSGFWHGANWTFIIWGLIHAVMYIPLFILNKTKSKEKQESNMYINTVKIFLTFLLTTLAWIFFRSDSIAESLDYIYRIITNAKGGNFYLSTSKYKIISFLTFLSIIFLIIVERSFFLKNMTEVRLHKYKLVILIIVIAFLGVFKNQNNFIYFQF